MMADKIRTFVACELPGEVRSAIGQIQEVLRQHRLRLKWVRPENIHLTLQFLGDVSAQRIEAIAGGIEKAVQGHCPLMLSAKGVGAFPSLRRARVIWVGIGGQVEQLKQLQASVAGGLTDVGFPKEKRAFKGHLTIARVKHAIETRQLTEALSAHAGFETAAFGVDQVAVMRSQLRPDGPVYTRLKTIKLRALSSIVPAGRAQ